MSTSHRAGSGRSAHRTIPTSRTCVLIVAAADTQALVVESLRSFEVDVRHTATYGAMADALFEELERRDRNQEILFIVDLRISCGKSVLDARLRDYDAALNDYVLSGRPWPQSLCLVEIEQTHPAWLYDRPHLRATLLADEVETVVGHPRGPDWRDSFKAAVRRCLVE